VSRAHPPTHPAAQRGPAPRTPAEPRAGVLGSDDSPVIDREGAIAPLRLAIGKDGLGIELAGPATVQCLDVVELVVRLPHVKFPFDVSGGVAKFRHKRGELERLAIELDARRVARWAEPRLRGLLSPGRCTVIVQPRAFGATVTVHARSTVSAAAPHTRLAALAFEVALVPAHVDLALVVFAARGANLVEPATSLAIRAMAALVGDAGRREGARFVMADAAGRLARGLLPEAGVRAPSAEDMRLVGSGESDGVLFVAFVRGEGAAGRGSASRVPDEATLAAETALLTREADDARMDRELDRARQLDLVALERAPKHPEIAKRIAELDFVVGGRAEAASTTLREIATPTHLGLLAGDLLNEAGDVVGAVAALLRSAERDPSQVLAALAFARAAELARDPYDALAWLDSAVARAPRIAELRWERAQRRLAAGQLADARADFQELEALAQGSRDRHDVLRRAGDVYRTAGLGADAGQLYERALLYRPDDPQALAGLGAALASEGRAARGAAILAHAIELAEARAVPAPGAPSTPVDTAWMHLELGRVLGERLGDRPAAVARLRAVPDDAREAIAARGLEGRLRGLLGDASGASLAFARMRERAGREPGALAWLEEAARFEAERGELHAAQRHLAAAIGIAPGDAVLEACYRAVGVSIAG
jgi:tetratricopeptide (TPR) repeat protein